MGLKSWGVRFLMGPHKDAHVHTHENKGGQR
jgi:hypothetical protein